MTGGSEAAAPASARRAPPRRKAAASALGFACTLTLFLLGLYAMVTYGLLFGVHQAMTVAAQDAARATAACDPALRLGDPPAYDRCVTERARATAGAALAWLSEDLRSRILGAGNSRVRVETRGDPEIGLSVEVRVEYAEYAAAPILPAVSIFRLGRIPPLPDRLAARAVVKL